MLAWRYTGAQRRGGGAVWRDGPVDVRALGVGHLAAVEQAVEALHVEALARRGPWALTADGPGRVRLHGPGGPIAGINVHLEADGWAADVVTAADGVVAFDPPAGEVRAGATAPGAGIALVAPGSQRLAMAGPAELVATVVPRAAEHDDGDHDGPADDDDHHDHHPADDDVVDDRHRHDVPTTSSTTTTTITADHEHHAPPPPPPTSGRRPTAPPDVPPHLPPTGAGSRDVARLGAWLFALGSLATCVARRRAH